MISSAANAYRKVAPFTSTLVSLLSGSTMTMASMSRLHQRLVMSEMGSRATVRRDIVASAIREQQSALGHKRTFAPQ